MRVCVCADEEPIQTLQRENKSFIFVSNRRGNGRNFSRPGLDLKIKTRVGAFEKNERNIENLGLTLPGFSGPGPNVASRFGPESKNLGPIQVRPGLFEAFQVRVHL